MYVTVVVFPATAGASPPPACPHAASTPTAGTVTPSSIARRVTTVPTTPASLSCPTPDRSPIPPRFICSSLPCSRSQPAGGSRTGSPAAAPTVYLIIGPETPPVKCGRQRAPSPPRLLE